MDRITRQEVVTLREMLFGTQAGLILQGVLRKLGHIDEEIGSETERIEHNTVKRILLLCGANIEFGREEIELSTPKSTMEQGDILGVEHDNR